LETKWKNFVTSQPNTEGLHHVAGTVVMLLQEAHSLNAVVVHFPESSFVMELLSISFQVIV
jgi:hypothetical protein